MQLKTDVLIAGGSFGGVSAALACAKMGKKCVLVEECAWIGGQATAQGVPLDEHPWIERYGRTRSYAEFRDRIRRYYRSNYPLTGAAMRDPFFNPGAAWVTALGYEPRVGVAVLYEMLAPYLTRGLIAVYTGFRPASAQMNADKCVGVTFMGAEGELCCEADIILDATELGDLFPLTGTEHSFGAESRAQTGEPLALDDDADPLRQQGFTHLVAVSYHPGEDHTIEKPALYERFRDRLAAGVKGRAMGADTSGGARMRYLFGNNGPDQPYEPTVWNFRRSFCARNFEGFDSDITMLMNGNEYRDGVLMGVPEEAARQHLYEARQMTLSLLYYLQTEAENGENGKRGLPGLRPRGDVFGTPDGLAQYPYIRESRRLRAEFTVLEQHFRIDEHPGAPMPYPDSVGLGGYRIDVHEPAKSGRASLTIASHGQHWVQQIPLGAMIPVRVENLLPACKNLGVTHVTNGAFRLHPVEWNVGEAAGALAAFCLQTGQTPRSVRNTPERLAAFQSALARLGVELSWPAPEFGRSYFSHYDKDKAWYFGEAHRL